jgi:hypothetical protein
MLMLAVLEHSGTAVPQPTPGVGVGATISDNSLESVLVTEARRLSEAIDHHRDEGRNHSAAARKHRGQMRDLLQQRNKHIAELSAAGWPLSRIASLYLVSSERIGQLVRAAALRPDVDDGAEEGA